VLTDSAKAFLSIGGVAVVAGAAYLTVSGDDAGIALLGFLLAAAAFVGLMSLRYRDEPAPPIVEDAPPAEPRPVRHDPLPGGAGWPMLGAASGALALAGFVLGPVAAVSGCVLAVIVASGWLAVVASERTGRRLNLLPLSLPLMGFFAIGALIFCMSRILLAVPSATASYVTAIVVAAAVLAGGWLFSSKPNVSSSALVMILAVVGVLFLTGGFVAAAVGERETKGEGFAGPVSITARNLKFDKRLLELRAEQISFLHFVNDDTDPHNVAIYTDESARQTLFSFPAIPGPTEQDYRFTAPGEGEYFFRCDVHPTTMTGRVVVERAHAEGE
jgi:plastocyanin